MFEKLSDSVIDFAEQIDDLLGEYFLPSRERGKAIVKNSRFCKSVGHVLMFGVAVVGSALYVVYEIGLCLVGAAADLVDYLRDWWAK